MDININELKKICIDFFNLAGTGFSLWDEAKNNIFSYPESHCSFCKCIRENRDLYLNCIKSDTKGLKEVDRTKKPYIYTCHMGLTEAIVPILQDDEIAGYLMMGQIACRENTDTILKNIKSISEKNDFKARLSEKLSECTSYSNDKITYCVNTLKVLVDYMNLSYVFEKNSQDTFSKVKRYISDNISSPVLPKDICKNLGISSSTLYKTVVKNTGMNPSHLIRKMKIDKAKSSLVNTFDSLSEIAEQCGISDVNYFIRIFKSEVGISPLKYRKNTK